MLVDAWNDQLQPIYNYLADLPGIAGVPYPVLPPESIARNWGNWSSFDLGRGCPFACSFCTIINVQGRKSRFRTPDDLEKLMRENLAQGVKAFFITDDNLVRNKHWEDFFDRLIHLRETEGLKANLTIQVDTLCHRVPNFIDKAVRAGVNARLRRAGEHQPGQSARRQQEAEQDHRIPRHVSAMARTRRLHAGAATFSVFPPTRRSRSFATSRSSSASCRSTSSSSSSSRRCRARRTTGSCTRRASGWIPTSTNTICTTASRIIRHMSDAEWEETYKAAWATYFTWEHMETVARRHARLRMRRPHKAMQYLNEFRMLYENEGVHTLEGGVVRRKRRCSRRPDLEARAGRRLLSEIRPRDRRARRSATGAVSSGRRQSSSAS